MRLLSTGVLCMLALNAQANVIQYFAAGISYSNPADLFKVKKHTFIVGGTGSYADLRFEGSVLNFNTFQYGTGVNSSREYTLLPYGRIAQRVNEKAVFALDITEPYNSNLKYGDDAFTRWANTQNLLTDVDISPKLSYAVSKSLQVGGGLNFNFITDNQVNFAYPTGPTTYSNLISNSKSFGLGYNLGFTYFLNQTNFLSALYYSGIHQHTKGYSVLGPNYSSNYSVFLPLPSTASISYVHIFSPEWLMNLRVFRTGWNAMKTANLYNTAVPVPNSNFSFKMNYNAGYAYQATVRKQYNKQLGIAIHGMIDDGPENDFLRTIAFPSDTQYLIGISGDYHFTPQTSVELFYGHVISHPTFQNTVTTPGGPIPFTTGKMDINADILDLKLKIEV